jgi:SAM-dependent methyltransferase
MAASLSGLHQRYRLQATWTASIRERLLSDLAADTHPRILEVGSGTGVITGEISRRYSARSFGVDIEPGVVAYAATQASDVLYAAADGVGLPFKSGEFDASVCHYLLLWVADPAAVLREMVRVTRSGGRVFALAEPDYLGRIDHPPELLEFGILQAGALESQGADPSMGRKLRGLFNAVGLVDVRAGVLGGEWQPAEPPEVAKSEWEMIQGDLADLEPDQLAAYHRSDEQARRSGERILYVPTFYAVGSVS